eukprot:g5218.t1
MVRHSASLVIQDVFLRKVRQQNAPRVRPDNIKIKLVKIFAKIATQARQQIRQVLRNATNVGMECTSPTLECQRACSATEGDLQIRAIYRSAECAPCPSGTFSNSQGSRNCTIVTPGFVIGDGNTSQIECGPGTFSAPNKLKCLDCPIETYQPSYGASECAQCKPGQTTTTNGSRACISKQCNFYTEYLDMSRGKSFDDWECVVCPDGGSCIGDNVVKDDIMAKQGYWRVPNTISFSQCLVKDACVGVGEETTVTSANSTEKAIEQCNEEIGYKENCTNYATRATERCRLCAACASGFKRVGSRGQCVPCPEEGVGIALIPIGICILILAMVGLIAVTIKSGGGKDDSISDIIKKVAINYAQLVSLASQFPLEWPPVIQSMFLALNTVSSGSGDLLNPACVLSYDTGKTNAEIFYVGSITASITPIMAVVLSSTVWKVIQCARKQSKTRTITEIDCAVLSNVLILFVLYPSLVRKITLYVVGLPFAALLILWRKRKKLHDPTVLFRYGLLFNGYRKEKYWWEGAIAMRKVLVVLLGVLGALVEPQQQVSLALMLVFAFLVLHLAQTPFEMNSEELNSGHAVLHRMESMSLCVAFVTFWGGLMFYSNKSVEVKIGVSMFLIVCNAAFVIWLLIWFLVGYRADAKRRKKARTSVMIAPGRPSQPVVKDSLLKVSPQEIRTWKRDKE